MPEIEYVPFYKPADAQKSKRAKAKKIKIPKIPPVRIYKEIPDIEFDPKEETAKYELFNTDNNLFITGKAGTGKSTLLREFVEYCQYKGKNVAVVAPTGIAAINVGGVTIHSFFQLSIDNATELAKLNPLKKKILEEVDILIIDEVSMVSDLIFGQIDKRMNQAKYAKNPLKKFFGGSRVILFGDPFQLGPVSKEDDERGYFFESSVFQQMHELQAIKLIELTKVWRQDEEDFLELLSGIRSGVPRQSHLNLLNTNIIDEEPQILAKRENITILCTLNSQVNRYNRLILNTLDRDSMVFSGQLKDDFKYFEGLPPLELELKIESLVVFLKNDLEKRWVNGDFGIVQNFAYRLLVEKNKSQHVQYYYDFQDKPEKIKADIGRFQDDGYQIIKAGYIIEVLIIRSQEIVKVEKTAWEKKQYTVVERVVEKDGEEVVANQLNEKIIGSYHQFPLKLGYAITVHKSQGMTLSGAIVDFSSGSFGSGLLYVALSRVKSLKSLYVTTPIDFDHIKLDARVVEFYNLIHTSSNSLSF